MVNENFAAVYVELCMWLLVVYGVIRCGRWTDKPLKAACL